MLILAVPLYWHIRHSLADGFSLLPAESHKILSLKRPFQENRFLNFGNCYRTFSRTDKGFLLKIFLEVVWNVNSLIISLFSLRVNVWYPFHLFLLLSSRNIVSFIWYISLFVILYQPITKRLLIIEQIKRLYITGSYEFSARAWRQASRPYQRLSHQDYN